MFHLPCLHVFWQLQKHVKGENYEKYSLQSLFNDLNVDYIFCKFSSFPVLPGNKTVEISIFESP